LQNILASKTTNRLNEEIGKFMEFRQIVDGPDAVLLLRNSFSCSLLEAAVK